jgi:hypothetical protein
MYKISKSEFFGNFGPLIEHGPHWINFIILTFISEYNNNNNNNNNNNKFRCLYKIWNKYISFDMKKKMKSKIGHRFYEEKAEFEGSRRESLCFKWGIPTILGPLSSFTRSPLRIFNFIIEVDRNPN